MLDEAGRVPEGALIPVLALLLLRQLYVLAGLGDAKDLIDVLSLSLGYYHEDPDDHLEDAPLRLVLQELGRLGVAVVASAGNQTTTEPLYPAAFSGQTELPFDPARVPLVSVGALNPDGTVAYFSNDGPWVGCWRPGAAIVSTMPTDIVGELQPRAKLTYEGHVRSTIDPDRFKGGFGAWSGTSFAGPVLAGQLAARLAADPTLPDVDVQAGVARAWRAVCAEVGWRP
jgi:subtilisin family serine protease